MFYPIPYPPTDAGNGRVSVPLGRGRFFIGTKAQTDVLIKAILDGKSIRRAKAEARAEIGKDLDHAQ